MMKIISVQTMNLLVVVFLYPGIVSSFILRQSPAKSAISYHTLFLAKVKTKNQKKKTKSKSSVGSSPSGGGFAKKDESTKSSGPDDDYVMFPKLEPNVCETILQTPSSMMEEIERTGSVPLEVYDRLEQIYGFPNFNHEISSVEKIIEEEQNNDEEEDGSFSFEDLLAAPSPSVSNTNTKDTTTTSYFSDLIAAATGGDQVEKKQDSSNDKENNTVAKSEMRNAISSLTQFEKVQVLHLDPLILQVDDFLSEEECDRYVDMSLAPVDDDGNQKTVDSFQTRSKTVGKDANAKAQRTSTTWFHHYRNVPELMAKASRLVGLDSIDRWEEPQTVRYQRSEKFTWHLDALAPVQSTDDLGGQRLATLIVYLKDLESGGATVFRDLGPLKVQPKKGSALLFFPAAGGIPNAPFDIRTLHCGEIVPDASETDKWISQLWLRAGPYSPTAPPGNLHEDALNDVKKYCDSSS